MKKVEEADLNAHALSRFLRSPVARQAIADEEARLAQRRVTAIQKVEQQLVEFERELVNTTGTLNARIDAETSKFSEAHAVFLEAQSRLTGLLRERMRKSHAADAQRIELESRLAALRDGQELPDDA